MRQKKRVGAARLHGYLNYLCLVIRTVQKDLDQVTAQDLEQLVEGLESGRIESRMPVLAGKHGFGVRGGKLSTATR